MSEKKVFEFKGQQVNVVWDRRLCIHVGECGQSKGELFEGGRDPWCIPDLSDPSEIADVCERCPSGALTTTGDAAQVEKAPPENSVNVVYNGPLYVHGDLTVEGAPEDMPGIRFRAALCRCGHSKNKPFCDNNHLKVGFEDYAAVGEKGPGVLSNGGKLDIRPLKDGPLMLQGNITMYAGSGRKAWQGEKAALCRCGESANKPFCDGSHVKAGFKSD
jgi:CDGSH-type Zn-finger protein/uncharacterized Fe-S cluster protein YjdI